MFVTCRGWPLHGHVTEVTDATWSVLCMGPSRMLPRWAGNLRTRWVHHATITDSLSLSLGTLLTICYSVSCFSYKALGSALRFGRRFSELPEFDRIVNVRSYMAFCLDGELRQSGMRLQRTAFGKCFPLLFWHCESVIIFWTINTDSMDITWYSPRHYCICLQCWR